MVEGSMCEEGSDLHDGAMKRRVELSPSRSRRRLGLISVPVMVSCALAVSACSSGASSAPPTTRLDSAPSTSAAPAPTGAPAVDGESTDQRGAEIEAFLDELEVTGFEGVVALREGSGVTTRAYGTADRANDEPNDSETVFDIGSITKQFTAAAILRLEMDGRLSVNDSLGDHLPELPGDHAAITLHELLTHTSGVPNNLGPDDEPLNRADFLERFASTPLVDEPGTRFGYSNVGYALLAVVIEVVTGEPYEVFLRAALFEPSGMLDTGYVLPDWSDHTIAVGYDPQSGDRFGRPNERPWDVNGPYWNLLGNGGLLSTAADMLRWDDALLGDEVLDESAKAKFFAPHIPDALGGVPYGYGWQIIPTPAQSPLIKHDGGNHVFYADFLRLVEHDIAVFVATNSTQDSDGDIAVDIANSALGGALAAMFGDEPDGEPDDESERQRAVADAVRRCGFDGLSIDSLPDHREIETLPSSAAGAAAKLFVDLLAGGDAAERIDFATDHVSEEFGGADPAVIADDIEELQVAFADYEVVRLLLQDDRRFHLLWQGPDADLLLSVGFDENDPQRLACLAVST